MRWAAKSLTVVLYDSGNYGVVVPRAGGGMVVNQHYLYTPHEVEHVTCQSNAEQVSPNGALSG